MQQAILQFRENIARVRHLGSLFQSIQAMTTPAIDLSDVLRAELVLAVSALDHLVHEMARLGMLEVYAGARPATDAYGRFRVPLAAASQSNVAGSAADWLDASIRDAHGWLSFQMPDRIADAIRLFSSVSLWPAISSQLGVPAEDIKIQLRAIVDRRNKIAHEADLDPSTPNTRWPIDEVLVRDAVDFVELLGETIFVVAQ